jgi:hypothetical protein
MEWLTYHFELCVFDLGAELNDAAAAFVALAPVGASANAPDAAYLLENNRGSSHYKSPLVLKPRRLLLYREQGMVATAHCCTRPMVRTCSLFTSNR